MESTNVIGIIRTLDDLGRIVIPKEIRRSLGVHEGDNLDILTTTDGGILLRKVEGNQPVCGCTYVAKTEPDNRVVHLINEYEEETKVIKITPEQDKLLHWLYDEGFLHNDIVIGDGYPFPEIKDLT